MFPINGAFYIPMFYYHPHPYLISNPQFLYPQMNIFPKTQNSFDSTTSLTVSTQNERKHEKQNDNSELYIPVKNQEKTKDFMKKKIIRKRFQKTVDSAEQAQRLRRKLANRPKTYQTQKKMYLSVDLSQMNTTNQGRRTLRKRLQQTKKENIHSQTSSKYEVEENSIEYKREKKLEQTENQVDENKAIKKLDRKIDFYNPQAEIPRLYSQVDDLNSQMEQKRMSLFARKLELKSNFLQ